MAGLCIFIITFFIAVNDVFSAASEFTLGNIEVTAQKNEIGEVGFQTSSFLTKQDLGSYNRSNLGDALNLLSGVSLSTNQRNEKTIAVRGFDSRQIPLFIDGIPVYVPFDGYIDFNRFSTADLASIHVAKGFSSVAYGANTIGGAINLISRKPEKSSETDLTFGIGSGNEKKSSINIGTNQGRWYLQSGYSTVESDYFPMSDKYGPTASENGKKRNNSYRKDSKVSAKIGLTPKGSDEYALSYYLQKGEKGQPPSTDPSKSRYWKWPYWNKESLYFLSQTSISSAEILKFRFYQDRFDNEVNSFTDATYSVPNISGPNSITTGRSIYHDITRGGSASIESYRLNHQAIILTTQFKIDNHNELDGNSDQVTEFKDQIISYGFENNLEISTNLTLSLGLLHNQLTPQYVYSKGNPYKKPNETNSTDLQAGLFYKTSFLTSWHITAAKKSRMPTLKDRYSQRLGTFIQNLELRSEKSLNLEIGMNHRSSKDENLETAFFYSKVSDKIQTVANVQGNKSQMQNVDKVQIYGYEIDLKKPLLKRLFYKGNYTYIFLKNTNNSDTKIIDIPSHKLQSFLTYTPAPLINLTPSVEYNSRRWTNNKDEVEGFTLFNFKIDYKIRKNFLIESGINNIFDRNYSLARGFPSPGRMYFLNGTFEL